MKEKADSGWRCAVRLSAGLLVVVLVGGGVARAASDAPVFLIETITVETERLSPEIVISESLLRENREYSETELREAVHRINQLPFVLLAEFSLRKGSERGRYELVVQVYEARRWFSQLALGIALNDSIDRFRVDDFGEGFLRTYDDDNFDAIIGRRFAAGPRGLLFASFGTEAGLFALGYQRYNLWDRNILLSFTVAGEDEFNSRSRAVRAQLGIPIRGNHALRLLAGWNWFDYHSSFFTSGAEIRETELEIAWAFNSRDDPVLPREGSLLELGLTGSSRYDRRDFLLFDGSTASERSTQERLGLFAAVARHWPLADRQSFSASIGGSSGDDPVASREWTAEASLGHQVFLLRNQEPGKWRELRLETRLYGSREEYIAGLVAQGLPAGENVWRLNTGLTYRNGWGLFRFFVEHRERSFI